MSAFDGRPRGDAGSYSSDSRVGAPSARVGGDGHIGSGTNRAGWDVDPTTAPNERYERGRLDGTVVGNSTNEEERDGAAIA